MPPPPRRPDPSTAATSASSAGGGSGNSGAGAARKEDNVYIPAFIAKQPFYLSGLDDEDDTLVHQRSHPSADSDASKKVLPDRVRKTGPARTKWVKGSCENCGAMGHKKKDCLERPRRVGARFTGMDIQADRAVRDIKMGYEAKRDIWAAYDPKQYQEVVEEYNLVEEARRRLQAETAEGGGGDGDHPPAATKDDEEAVDGTAYETGFKYAEETDMSKDRTVKQSMRIREDTAKYLLNLDTDSAKYNPKKRALVDPGALGDNSAKVFAEENYLRASGEAAEFEKAQRYAWEKQERSGDTNFHLQANPTAGALLRKTESEEREAKRRKRAQELAEQYGEQPVAPEALKVAITESEMFAEYDEAGLIKGARRKVGKSKYAEDVLTNNHTSVWGSWWSDFRWGYACCHSFIKNSYCTGDMGKKAITEAGAWDKE